MGYSEPYSAWFDAVKAALVDAAGPFTKSAQVEFWDDVGIDDLLPDDRLIGALTRNMPHALLSWTGGSADDTAGGGNSHRENVEFVLRYAAGAPGEDFENALRADGTHYWGAWAVHDWILEKVFQLEVVSFEAPPVLLGVSPIGVGRAGVLAYALRFSVPRLRSYAD